MKLLLVIFIFIFSVAALSDTSVREEEKKLSPFRTDKCSSWVEGRGSADWSSCCYVHDLAYWKGGTKEMKEQADRELRSCVKKSGSSIDSFIMWVGVKIGGGPKRKTSYRWGYGWKNDFAYKYHTRAEKELILESLYLTRSNGFGFLPLDQDLEEAISMSIQEIEENL